MSRLFAATPVLVLAMLALGGCMTYSDRPLYAANPAYYDYYGPGYYVPGPYAYGPYYGPRSYSTFDFSIGRGRHHHHYGHRHRHHHRRW